MKSYLVDSGLMRKSMAGVGLFALGAIGATGIHKVWADNPRAVVAPPIGNKTAALVDIESGLSAIADRLEPSMVTIEVEKKVKVGNVRMPQSFDFGDEDSNNGAPKIFQFPGGRSIPREFNSKGAGSGVIVRSDGWILTNDHVVGGADKVSVTLHDGRVLPGVVRRDYLSDLAVVKIEASGLQQVEFADSDKVKVGQWAIAFGSPFELNDTMTVGVVSARQRQKLISENGEARFYPSLLQTDASINPGNSGGALVDSMGRVMGINVAIGSPNGGNVGIGFAIPANTAKDVMDKLISGGKVVRGYLGVAPKSLTPELKKRYGVEAGALVENMQGDTPAGAAGLQVEDVITKFDNKPVTDDISLRALVARTEPGKKVDIVVVRDGKAKTLTATIGTVPTDRTPGMSAPKPAEPTPAAKVGISVAEITADVRTEMKLPAGSSGVVVREVMPGSPAAEVGIQAGDVVSRVNGKSINSPSDLKQAVSNAKSGDTIRMVVQRGSSRSLINVTLP